MTLKQDKTGAYEPLDRIIADYLQAVEAGRLPDRQALLRDHPTDAEQLRAFFADYDRMGRQASAFRIPNPDETVTAGGPGQTDLPRVRYLGDFELLNEIARGGMGVVFKARQVTLNRIVALKMILAGTYATEEAKQRFRAEAKAAANLDHPNILPIYEVGEHEGHQYFSMKLVEGGSLLERIPSLKENPKAVAELMATLCRAVHFAHQRGTLHRDLKPANILLDSDGTPFITDFGLARKVDRDNGSTKTGAVLGTPSYMPPEQARGEKGLTMSADIYSLGAILYELLTGKPPFKGESVFATVKQVMEEEPTNPQSLNPKADRDLAIVALKCLRKEPAERYSTAADLADDLDRWTRGEPISARPTTMSQRAWMWMKRNKAVAGLGAGLAAALVLGTFFSLAYAFKAHENEEMAIYGLNLAGEKARQARAMEEESKDNLLQGHFDQAQALRLAHQPGWRERSLKLLQKATVLRNRERPGPTPKGEATFPIPEGQVNLSDLRSEATMAIIQRDIMPVREVAINTQRLTVFSQDGSRIFQQGPSGSPLQNRSYVIALATGEVLSSIVWDQSNMFLMTALSNIKALNRDGTLALCQKGDSGPTEVREIPSGKLLTTLPEAALDPKTPASEIPKKFRLLWSGDGRRILAVRYIKGLAEIIVWDFQSLAQPRILASSEITPDKASTAVFDLSKDTMYFASLRVSPDGKRMSYLAPNRKALRVVNLAANPPVIAEIPAPGELVLAEWNPTAPVLAMLVKTEPNAQRILLWDVAENKSKDFFDGTFALGNAPGESLLAFSPNGLWLALKPTGVTVHVFETSSGSEVGRIPNAATELLSRLVWTDNNEFITYGMMEKTRIWNVSVDPPIRSLDRVLLSGRRPAFSPDGKRFAAYTPIGVNNLTNPAKSGSYQFRVAIINRASGTVERYLDAADPSRVGELEFSPDITHIAMTDGKEILVRDVATGKEVLRRPLPPKLAGDRHPVQSFYHRDGTLLVLFDELNDKKHAIQIRDVRAEKSLLANGEMSHMGTLTEHVLVSPEGDRALIPPPMNFEPPSATEPAVKKTSRLIEMPSGKLLTEFVLEKGERDYLQTMCLSRNSRYSSSLSMQLDAILKGGAAFDKALWVVHEIATGKEVLHIPNSASSGTPFVFSPDEKYFALSAAKGHIELWDIATRELVFRWQPYGGKRIHYFTFTPDGDLATTADGRLSVLKMKDLRAELAKIGLDWQ